MKKNLKIITLLAVFTIFLSVSLARAGEPTDQLKGTIDEILVILKDTSLKGPENKGPRREKLQDTVEERFSFKEMSKRSLGKNWKKLTKDQKRAFVPVFASLIENSYFTKMEAYTDEEILFEDERTTGKSSVVKTKVITKKGTEIPINYRLKQNKKGTWLVYDIVVEGVSLVRNYRTQFAAELKGGSIDELVAKLEAKSKEKTD